jgi:hypothetical protein
VLSDTWSTSLCLQCFAIESDRGSGGFQDNISSIIGWSMDVLNHLNGFKTIVLD